MIGNKYGKVIIIALINILAVFLVYNNAATGISSIVQEHLLHQDISGGKEEIPKHGDDTNIPAKNSDNKLNSKHGQTTNIDKSLKGKNDNQKHATNTAGDTQASVENLKTKHKSSSKHDAVMSMKNLLSIQIHAVRVNRTTTVPPKQKLGEELQERLLDSSEIDLSPPNPVIIPPSEPIREQVGIDRGMRIERV